MSELSQRLADLSPAKRRLLEQRLASQADRPEPIALVGMACRFAGAADLDAYWRLIVAGVDATSEIPPDRWDADAFYDADHETPGRMTSRWGGFVGSVDQFDPQFFGIAPREASRMDPQQRLLLEVSWEALEHAGLAAERVAGTATGVFVGIGGSDYAKIPMQFENFLEYIDAHVGTGNALSIAANRISYILDLHGPSLAVDTACSSSLLAVHLAVNSLRRRECDAALAAGVNLILTPEVMVAFSKARMLSPTGQCRPFDAAADGYVRGEGCGVLVLKRLGDAVRDGDRVLAVIRGSAANQDGRTSGITAPNSNSQHECIRAALANAGVSAQLVSYLEAHGTGTPLGDPIEVLGLKRLYARRSPAEPPCYMASVKANIGHTETASGVASIIKVALMMQHGLIPAQTNFAQLNGHIPLEGSRLTVPRQSLAWTREAGPRLAGVSSYGFGGTNVHIVLEDPAPREPAPVERDRPLHLLVLSAKTKTALAAQAERYAERLDTIDNVADFCHAANAGRAHFHHRAAIVAANREQLRQRLTALAEGKSAAGVKTGQIQAAARPRVAFLFTGQGSQYAGMARELFDSQPVFRQALDECAEILRPLRDEPLLSVIFPADGQASLIDETTYTQPALFAVEYALARLWQSWGVEPDVVLGHSVGEYVAACIAGVFSLEDGLRLIARRAQLMQQLQHDGLMAVVFAEEQRVRQALTASTCNDVAIAAANGPENTVISGRAEVVRQLVAAFETAGLKTQLLTVSHAFHSPLMEPMLDEFERFAATIAYQPPRMPIVSNLTGELIEGTAPEAAYWRQHLRQAVRFAAGMKTLAAQQVDAVLEIGTAPILLGMGRRCQPDWNVAWLPSLRKGHPNWDVLLDSLGKLYLLGFRVDWAAFDRPWPRQHVDLPTYPFERSRFWMEAKGPRHSSGMDLGLAVHPLLGSHVPSALESHLFAARLSTKTIKYLADHKVQGSVVVPGAAWVEMGLAAADEVYGRGQHTVAGLSIQQPLFLAEGATRLVQTVVSAEIAGQRAFEIYSTPAESEGDTRWLLHATGKLLPGDSDAAIESRTIDLEEVRGRTVDVKDRAAFYAVLAARELTYGPAFQGCDDLCRSDRDVVARLDPPNKTRAEAGRYRLHPAILDAAFQATAGIVPLEPDGSYSPYTYIPVGVDRVTIVGDPAVAVYTYAVRTSADYRPSPEVVESDVFLLDADGLVVVEVKGFRTHRVGRASDRRTKNTSEWLYQIHWQPAPPASIGSNGQPSEGWWLVLADERVGPAFAERLRLEGRNAVLLPFQDESLDPLSAESVREAVESAIASEDDACAGAIYLWGLDVPSLDAAGPAAMAASHAATAGLMDLVQQLQRAKFRRAPALFVVTQGAQNVAAEPEAVAAGQTPLWGLGRAAAMENPEFHTKLIDLDPAESASASAARLVAELPSGDDEDQLAYRRGERLAPRLLSAADILATTQAAGRELTVPADGPMRLHLGTTGSFDGLNYEGFRLKTPGPEQVEIEVSAAGLNFSDVLKAMGLYPGITDDIVPLGIECAGVVAAVGEGVTRFRPGDAVLGVAPYSFASHAITAEYAVAPKPAGLSDEEAATVPITFLTAHYALCHLAQLQPGERVLIHAGAGGVGLAAIQIAQHLGAEIFATAGSESKRDFLRSLGVRHVMDSRTTDFAAQIMEVTGRQGVDVVLNSLPGEAISKSLEVLRAYGRFLEIGKTDIYQNRMLGLLPFQDNLSYFAIDLDRMLRQRPALIQQLFDEVMEQFAAGVYRPLPLTRFAAAEIREAFRYMAQRKNIGKVVVSMADRPAATEHVESRRLVRSDGSYLITGGLGALGLKVAEWLAEQGAEHLVLLGRRPPNKLTNEAIAAICERGVAVAAVQGDVVDRASLDAALRAIPADFPPLRGVVHAAGVLADGLLFDMDLTRLDLALLPKTLGAWNLHAATLDTPLDFFVLFSSVAATLGSPGQANYAAGNAFLDALAAYRRAQGLPALSVNWGPWGEAGMAAEGARAEQLRARGMQPLDTAPTLEMLGRLLRNPHGPRDEMPHGDREEYKVVNVAVMDVDWRKMRAASGGRDVALLRALVATDEQPEAAPHGKQVDRAFLDKLKELDEDARKAALAAYFSEELARIMGIDAGELEADRPLNSMGLDSLMAMELKNNLEGRLAFSLPMAKFFEGPSVNSLAAAAVELIGDGRATAAAPAFNPLVKLSRGDDSRPPLFCFHPLGGDTRCYQDMARQLDSRQTVYAVRARGSDGLLPPHPTLPEALTDYLAAIRRVQPAGPYFLAGWSAGGIYAYEMARTLLVQGESVGLLALIDTPLPSIYDKMDLDDEARFLFDLMNFTNRFTGATMDVSYEQLRAAGPEAFRLGLDEAKRKGVVPAEASEAFIHRLCQVGRENARWIMDYRLAPIALPVHLIRPAEQGALSEVAGQAAERDDLGWGDVLGGRLTVHVSPGDHFSMLSGDHAAQLAALLGTLLSGEDGVAS